MPEVEYRMIHRCRICQGDRPHNGTTCLGCGTLLVKCKETKEKRNRHECPGCTHTGPHQITEHGRWRCVKCTAIFEGPDFGFVDDRPEVNAAKKERAASEMRKRGTYANR